MGTRADFYVGRGATAEWLGSVAWDGYPDGFDADLFGPATEEEWRGRVVALLASREDATLPEHGWPWPWETSNTTDFAYALDGATIYASNYGGPWFDPLNPALRLRVGAGEGAVFPNMKDRQNVTLGKRSGVIVVG